MDSGIHDPLLASLGLLLKTGLPLFLALVFAFFSGKSYSLDRDRRTNNRILILAEALATGLWIFLCGEHYSHGAIPHFDLGASLLRDLEANNIPILLVFLPAFGVAALVTESQLCALRRALKTNKNPASYGEIIYFQVP